jgi:hypothetical protein
MMKMKISDVARQCKRPYQEIYLKVVAGLIPAERTENGSRWLIDEKDLPLIAAELRPQGKEEGKL